VRVPDEIRSILRKTELKKSFGEIPLREANRLALLKRTEIETSFAEARALVRQKNLPPAEIPRSELLHLLRGYLHKLEAEEHERNASVPSGSMIEECDKQEMILQLELDVGLYSSGHHSGIQALATDFMAWAHINVDQASPLYWEACSGVQSVWLEHLERRLDKLRDIEATHHRLDFKGVDHQNKPLRAVTLEKAVELFEQHIADQNNTPATIKAHKGHWKAWLQLLPAKKAIGELTRQDIQDGLNLLRKVPARCSQLYPKKTMKEAIELAAEEEDETELLNPRTIANYLFTLKAMFAFVVDEEMIATSPAAKIKTPKFAERTRRPFRAEELQAFFRQAPFDKPWSTSRDDAALFWMPLLGLFTGARLSELAGIAKEDVKQKDGIWVIEIKRNKLRDLKTEASRRDVPIHRELIAAGFLKFIEATANGAHPMLASSGDEKRSLNSVQKQLRRHIRSIFPDNELVFHSFRHTFRDMARAIQMPLDVVADIGGWTFKELNTPMEGYGRGNPLKVLEEWMGKARYDGLSLLNLAQHIRHSSAPLPSKRKIDLGD
jgi:integrase